MNKRKKQNQKSGTSIGTMVILFLAALAGAYGLLAAAGNSIPGNLP